MARYEQLSVGDLAVRNIKIGTKNVPTQATFAIAAGASNVTNVTITLKDAEGVALTNAAIVDLWLSDAATGLGITTTAASGTPAPTTGTILGIETTKKAWRVVSSAAGAIVLEITDTAKTTFYVAVGMNGANISVSRILATADYG